MKIRALLTAGLLASALVGPAFAFDHAQLGGVSSNGYVQKVVCDANGDGKQANCVRDCEDEEIRSRATYNTKSDEVRLAEKAACLKKCGC